MARGPVLASLAFVPLSLTFGALSARMGAWAEGYGPGTRIGGEPALVAFTLTRSGLSARGTRAFIPRRA